MSGGPLTVEVQIVNRRGLHARAAAKFVKVAEGYDARLTVCRDDMEVAGTSILGLMMLAASCGSTLRLSAQGNDAAQALQALADLVERGFDET